MSTMLFCILVLALSTMLFCILLLVLFTMLFCIILLGLSTMLFCVVLLVLSTMTVAGCAGSTDVGDGSVTRRGGSNQRYHDPLHLCFCLPGLPQLWRHLVSCLPACAMK